MPILAPICGNSQWIFYVDVFSIDEQKLFLPSFHVQFGFKNKFCATDAVLACEAMLESVVRFPGHQHHWQILSSKHFPPATTNWIMIYLRIKKCRSFCYEPIIYHGIVRSTVLANFFFDLCIIVLYTVLKCAISRFPCLYFLGLL